LQIPLGAFLSECDKRRSSAHGSGCGVQMMAVRDIADLSQTF